MNDNFTISEIFKTKPNLIQIKDIYEKHLHLQCLINEIEKYKPKGIYFRYLTMPTSTIDYISKNVINSYYEYDYDKDFVKPFALITKSFSIDENITLSQVVEFVLNISKERNEPNIYWYSIYKNIDGIFIKFATA